MVLRAQFYKFLNSVFKFNGSKCYIVTMMFYISIFNDASKQENGVKLNLYKSTQHNMPLLTKYYATLKNKVLLFFGPIWIWEKSRHRYFEI